MGLFKLYLLIEQLKLTLVELAEKYGRDDPRVLALSRRLDRYIVELQKRRLSRLKGSEYTSIKEQLMILASMVRELDLDEFINRIGEAEAVGPVVNPSVYQLAGRNLQMIKRLATAANVFRQEVLAQAGAPAKGTK